MDPLTMGLIGSAAVGAGSDLVGNVVSDIGNYHANKALAEQDREFQKNEAAKSRNWQSLENQIARDWQTNANRIAMDFSRQEAIAQREWQTEMSNTAHQREAADLRAAGLNPILAASQGADMGSGATASGVANSPSSVGSASTAKGSSAHVNSHSYSNFTKMVNAYLSNAHEISKQADKFDHEMEMLDKKQALEKDLFDYKNKKGSYFNGSKKSYDLDEFFQAAMNRKD